MYCRKCGEKIESDSLFCKHCGVEVNLEKTMTLQKIEKGTDNNISFDEESKKTGENHSEILSQENETFILKKQPSMRWYKALIMFFIPAALIIRPIESLGNLYLNVEQNYGSWANYFTHPLDGIPNTLNIILWLFGMILLFSAFKGIKKFTELGYKYIMMYFVFNAIYPIAAALIYTPSYIKAGIDFNYSLSLAQFIANSIISIPNLIYFKKRRHLFNDNEFHSLKIK